MSGAPTTTAPQRLKRRQAPAPVRNTDTTVQAADRQTGRPNTDWRSRESVTSVIQWKPRVAAAVVLGGNHAFGSIAGGLPVACVPDPNFFRRRIR
jgi:hypothetical protein